MADIAVSAVTKAIDIAANLVVKEGSRLYWLREDIDWIQREMRSIQSYLADADSKQDGNQGIKNFINNITDLAYDIEDIMDAYSPLMTMRNRRRGFMGSLMTTASYIFYDSWYTRHRLAMKIKKIRKRIEDIKSAKDTYGIIESSGGSSTWDGRRTFPHIDEPNIVGFEEYIENLKAKLLSTENLNHSVISIVGMPGLGKTTLARKVYNSVKPVKSDDRFECSAWICVSKDPIVKNLLQEVARQVGLEKEKWEQDVEVNLYIFLRTKRYVIVVDDIWDHKPWDALKVGIPTDLENGSKIIITSRNKSVGLYIGGDMSLHELLPLNPDDSWKLFSKIVMSPTQNTNETSCSSELKDLGRQIVKRCGGVPLAIVVTAGLLKSRDKVASQWRAVLESLGRQEDECSKILALSYKDLPTKLKPCFLYFGMFPEDHEISAFQLINMWIAERFVVDGQNHQWRERLPKYQFDDYLNQLIARNLVQVVRRRYDGRIKSYRIHDLLHNLCISEARKSSFFFNTGDNVSQNFGTRVRRVLVQGNSIMKYISLKNITPKLRALLFFNTEENLKMNQLTSFLGDSRFLRVLTIECENLGHLPNEIGSLSFLSYFELKGWGIELELPSTMGNLKKLQTLNVQRCGYINFPTFIWKMKELTHVLLPRYLSNPPVQRRSSGLMRWSHKLEVSLSNLQTLDAVHGDSMEPGWLWKLDNIRKLVIDFPSKQDIEVLSDETPVSELLEYLAFENLTITNNMRLNLSRYQYLHKLRLEGHTGKLPNPNEFPPHLTKLVLKDCYLKEDPLGHLKNLPKLQFLKLGFKSYEGKKMMCYGRAHAFPQLQVLSIRGLNNLEKLYVEGGGMPTLKMLQVNGCDKLTEIPEQFQDIMIRTSRLI